MGSIDTTDSSIADDQILSIDGLIRYRAKTHRDQGLFSYPFHDVDFESFDGHDIDHITAYAASAYKQHIAKKPPHHQNGSFTNGADETATKGPMVVGLVGTSNFEYFMSFMSLQRLGLVSMFLSPRLADSGYTHLLTVTGCDVVIASGPSLPNLERIRDTYMNNLHVIPMLSAAALLKAKADPLVDLPRIDFSNAAMIIHTGGTTGLPKPVRFLTERWLSQSHTVSNQGRVAVVPSLSTLPLFHAFGIGTFFRTLTHGDPLAILDPAKPMTVEYIWKALDALKCPRLGTVPYVLKFFADAPGGIERLAQLEQVIVSGAATPDDLGQQLTSGGVNLMTFYGQTESGALMASSPDDFKWYNPIPHAAQYLKFEEVGEDLYHLIVLPGLQTKILSDRPDGSYGTKDLFRRHPTDPHKYKFVARYDDIIVLVNGEKADPIPLEDAVMVNKNVQMAVVFGAGRDSLGMLIIPSEAAANLSREELVESLLPNLQEGNAQVPGYAKIVPESLVIKPYGTKFPMTEKSTLQRAMFNKLFSADIQDFYDEKERLQADGVSITDDQVGEVVRLAVEEYLGLKAEQKPLKPDVNFFTMGMDSLQASYTRAKLLRSIDLRGRGLTTNVVFDHPSVAELTQHILDVRHGVETAQRSVETIAKDMIEKYVSGFTAEPGTKIHSGGSVVLLTGGTGTIGVQIVDQLVRRENVSRLYCLVMASDIKKDIKPVHTALNAAHLLQDLSEKERAKITALGCNLGERDFGLTPEAYEEIRNSVTHVIHNAWSVNFNMNLESFEAQSIAGTANLINLALQSPLLLKPTFVFVSSVAAVLASQDPQPLKEGRHGWAGVSPMGYGQSKWVGEEISCAASEKFGLPVRITRVAQVSGDTTHGMWHATEAIPTTVEAALTIGALPEMEGKDELNFWLPTNTTAAAITDCTLLDRVDPSVGNLPLFQVFHVASMNPVRWNADFLPALGKAGLEFETLPGRQWVKRLEASDPDVRRNPPYKLLEHFKHRYGRVRDPVDDKFFGLDMAESFKYSPSLAQAPKVDENLIGKYLTYWLEEAWKDLPGLSNGKMLAN